MMKKTTLFISGWLILLLSHFLIQECWAGMVIQELHRDTDGRMNRVTRYYSGDQFRTDHPEGGISTIIDFKGDRIVMIDHTSRSYVDIKFSRWEKEVAERLRKSMPEIKPKERRIIVRGTGEKALINGFQTEKVEIRADGEIIEENWMTRDVDMKEVEKVMERVAKGFSKDFKVEMKEGREIYEKLKPYGIPILIRDYTLTYGLGPVNVMEVRIIEKKDLGSEVFLPPVGYQRIIPETPKK
ncbi:MAG: DUF4412 domain-containing protein [Deltaproteobacteria bacterium]|nr:DUF4412 domain-containing protein [Deltaproteobacteria bacterium]